MTLTEIALAARKEGLTYGQYVSRYRPTTTKGELTTPGKREYIINCAWCGRQITAYRKTRKYCCADCRNKAGYSRAKASIFDRGKDAP